MFSASMAHDYVEGQERTKRAVEAFDAIEKAKVWLGERMEAEALSTTEIGWMPARFCLKELSR